MAYRIQAKRWSLDGKVCTKAIAESICDYCAQKEGQPTQRFGNGWWTKTGVHVAGFVEENERRNDQQDTKGTP